VHLYRVVEKSLAHFFLPHVVDTDEDTVRLQRFTPKKMQENL
jgi:hypothetical protein